MKSCNICHVDKPLEEFILRSDSKDGRNHICRACRYARKQAWRKANPDKVAAQQRRTRERVLADPERHDAWKTATRARRAERRDEVNANHQRWLAANPERREAYSARLRERYVPHARPPGKGRDPLLKHAWKKRGRARERGATLSTLTAQQWAELKEHFNFRCAYCMGPVEVFTQDHAIALARGGQHTADNVVPACRSCNVKKGDRSLIEFIAATAQ